MIDLVNSAEKGMFSVTYGRWHNHLDSKVRKEPLTPEEERIIFQAQRTMGNKWADIAKLLLGRTDNVVKNYFYSTLRRELRKLIRKLRGNGQIEPKEVSVGYMKQLCQQHKFPFEKLENKNVRELMLYLEAEDENGPCEKVRSNMFTGENQGQQKKSIQDSKTVNTERRRSERILKRQATKKIEEPDNEDENKKDIGRRPKPLIKYTQKRSKPSEDSRKLFIIENEKDRSQYKIINRETMEHTDLLVSIHNSIVSYHNQ